MNPIHDYTLTFPDGLKLRVEHVGVNPPLTPDYWDCECEHDFIHSAAVPQCGLCGVTCEEGPDSHLTEVLSLVIFKQDV